MLVLTRQLDQEIMIGNDITVFVSMISGGSVMLTVQSQSGYRFLRRRKNEDANIAPGIIVRPVEISRNKVRLGIDAPKDVRVMRPEVLARIKEALGDD